MDSKREAFLARLRETFRVEAAEHLEAIGRGVLELDRETGVDRQAVVERVFREAHSLKGAARSVNLTRVEGVSAALEGVFAAVKRGEVQPSPGLLDAVQEAVAILEVACAGLAEPPAEQVTDREHRAVAKLQALAGASGPPQPRDGPTLPRTAPAQTPAPVGAKRSQEQEAAKESPPTPADPSPGDSVRVGLDKLDQLLRAAEGLLPEKLARQALANDLRALTAEVAVWNQRSRREVGQLPAEFTATAPMHAGPDVADLLPMTLQLEATLRKLSQAARRDASTFGSDLDRLLDHARSVLLLPCAQLLGPLALTLRELAREQGKDAELVIKGDDIELDRRVLEALKVPLTHLIRNSVDHGIEKPDVRRQRGKPARARVTLTVRPLEGQRISIEFADDGGGFDLSRARAAAERHLHLIPVPSESDRKLGQLFGPEPGSPPDSRQLQNASESPYRRESGGVRMTPEAARDLSDAEAIEMLFRSGVSTSPMVTDLSGRGLGLAIVREKLEQLGGSVTATSQPGQGARFNLEVPLTLATLHGVLVRAADFSFIIPAEGVVGVARWRSGDLRSAENRQVVEFRGRPVAWVRLRDVLGLDGADPEGVVSLPAVIVRSGASEVALQVDAVLGEQEVMVKDLGAQLRRVQNIAAASVNGSGAVVPVLSVADLVENARLTASPTQQEAPFAGKAQPRLLIAEDSITARTLLKSILEAAGYSVTATVDGLDALTRLKSDRFDLVVSDVDMPRLNGFELTARIRSDKKLADIPVVLCTALASQSDREHGVEVGASAYLVKSDFDQGNLLDIVRRFVG